MSKDNGCSSSTIPLFSVVIAVYNDWAPLEQCLRSLAQQRNAPEFEVIVVDDGSDHAAPDCIRRWACCYPLIIIRQSHAGIPTARNRGIRLSTGSVLVFTDADCRLQRNCLALLSAAVARSPQHGCFQLHLVGDCSNVIGRAEELRLSTLQNHMLQPRGCIRYLNTAGFAIRRTRVDIEKGLFDPVAFRAEDTLLLANLVQNGELPLFVTSAIIQHAIPLSLIACLKKDVRSAYLEAETYLMIASMGVRIRVSPWERLRILWSTWKTSRRRRSAWFVLICRQMFRRKISLVYGWSRPYKLLLWSRRPEEFYSTRVPQRCTLSVPTR
jgi:glycosyltransferase involved in cell wall biosynthesis